jgi:hypothetical protein
MRIIKFYEKKEKKNYFLMLFSLMNERINKNQKYLLHNTSRNVLPIRKEHTLLLPKKSNKKMKKKK